MDLLQKRKLKNNNNFDGGGAWAHLYLWKKKVHQISLKNGINTPLNSKVQNIFGR